MEQKSRSDYSMLNIAAGFGGYILNFFIGLVCRMIFTRTLAVDYLGVNGLFTNILSMLSLAELGIGTAIGYALYKPLAINDQSRVASLMKFYAKCYHIIGIIVAILGLCLLPFLSLLIADPPNIKEDLSIIFLLYLFNTASSYFFSYRSALLMAAQQNYLVTGINYLITIIQSIVQIILLLATHEYVWYLLVLIAGGLLNNIVISEITKKKYPYITYKNTPPLPDDDKKELIGNVRALTIWKLSGLLVNQTDNLIITHFNGLATVGLASNYTLLSNSINSILNILFNGITASVGNHNALENSESKYYLFKAINLSNFWLFGWASIGIFVCSTDIVKLLFGHNYALPLEIPFVIALNFYMVGMQSAVWTYKNTMGIFRQGRYLLFVTAAINLIASIFLGKIWGLFGILLATAISRAFTNTWYDPYAIHKYGFGISVKPYYKRYLLFAIIVVITGGVCYYICSLLHFSLFVNVILKFSVCCIIPNGIFMFLFRKLPEFQYLLKFADKAFGKLKLFKR